MSKNIIITCGTSLLNSESITDDSDLLEKLDEIEKTWDIEKYSNYFINNDFENIKTKKLKNFWAELNILKKIYENWDKIYLFFSQTNGWKIVKSIFEQFFKSQKFKEKILKDNNFNFNKQTYFITIEGFKVDNKELFKQKAIKDFFTKLEKIKKNWNKTVMCPVWWYKALIPYSSLYAMVQGWEIKYIYEDSDEIIDLPSWSLTNLSAERILNEKIDVKEIFSNENLSNNYSFDIGLKLIFWIKNFIDYWKSKDLSKIFERIEKVLVEKKQFDEEKKSIWNLKKYLENLSDAFDLIRLKDIKNNILKIKKVKINNFKDPLLKKFILFLQKELDKVDLNNIITWYFERWRYAEAILIMREWIIDFVWQRLNIPYIDRENRLKIEASLKLVWNKLKPYNKKIKKDKSRYNYLDEHLEQDLFKLFYWYENFWDELADKRNNFAHTNQGISLKVMKKWIINLYKTYKEITSSKSTF